MAESGGAATVTATLSNRSYQNVTVNLGYTGTATGGGTDYSAAASITVNAGTLSNSVNITGVNDALDENDETVIVDITSVTNGTENGTQQVTATITDDDAPPTISVNDSSVTEGDGGTVNLTFAVSLSAASGKIVTVDYATSSGTATAGADYTPISTTTLTFNPGVNTQNVTVTILGDLIDENNETLYLELTNPTNATIADAQGAGTITDNDPSPSLSINDVTVTEGNAGTVNAIFAVILSAASERIVTVNYAPADNTALHGDDYNLAANTLTFNPGATTQNITVQVFGDVIDENDETYYVNLSGASNATIADNQGVGTITDDDAPPTVSVNDPSVLEGDAGTVNLDFTISLSGVSGKTITVDYATSDGTATIADGDFVAIGTTTLTYTPGQTTKTVNVTINGDLTNEPNETLNLDLSNPTNATIADALGVGTITNDDGPPTLSVNDGVIVEGNAGTSILSFTVNLSKMSASTINVDYATANNTATAGADYVAVVATTLTYTPGQTSKTVDITINGDTMDEDNETFFVNLTNPTNAIMADAQGIGTITNDDGPPTLSINDINQVEGNSGTTNATFAVTLSQASGKTITVDYATTDNTALAGTDYTAVSGTLTFNPGVAAQNILVPIIGELVDEDDEAFWVNLSNPTNATIADDQGVGTINDDDGPPGVFINDTSQMEGNSGTTNATFTVTLSHASAKTITVDYTTADNTALAGTDYTAVSGTLTFNPGDTAQNILVPVIGEFVDEDDETFHVNLSNPTNATMAIAQGTGTITNSGDPSIPVPTMNEWGMIIFMWLLFLSGMVSGYMLRQKGRQKNRTSEDVQ